MRALAIRALAARALALVAAATAIAGCKPDFGTPASLVTGPRILAVRAEPPEVRAQQSATFTALVVSPSGTDATPPITWSLCVTPKPLDENNVVSIACLEDKGVMPLGGPAPTTMATVPANACALFGPDPPPQMMGQPPLRPRDPDITGGYYQPLRFVDGDVTGFALERITCDLAQAGSELAAQYAMTYQANTNPMLQPLTATVNGAAVGLDALPAGADVDFATSWPPESVESFPVFDVGSATLVTHRESMRVSWFANDGSFLHEVTGRDETETDTTTANSWTAPTTPGPAHLWIVLRDTRGGMSFASYDLVVVAP